MVGRCRKSSDSVKIRNTVKAKFWVENGQKNRVQLEVKNVLEPEWNFRNL